MRSGVCGPDVLRSASSAIALDPGPAEVGVGAARPRAGCRPGEPDEATVGAVPPRPAVAVAEHRGRRDADGRRARAVDVVDDRARALRRPRRGPARAPRAPHAHRRRADSWSKCPCRPRPGRPSAAGRRRRYAAIRGRRRTDHGQPATQARAASRSARGSWQVSTHARTLAASGRRGTVENARGARSRSERELARVTTSASRSATACASSWVGASTITRTSGSVPEGRSRIRPVSPSAASSSATRGGQHGVLVGARLVDVRAR